MGSLIAVIGNAGVGKTTLTRLLSARCGFTQGLEQHHERPFQQRFAHDLGRYALANQIDYLLFRAEQEHALRQQAQGGIQDGGLDEDFFIFTRYFFAQGYLDAAEFALCQRFYQHLRRLQPAPDVLIHLTAPLDVLVARYAKRGRTLEIATIADLAALDGLLYEWMQSLPSTQCISVDASADDPAFAQVLETLIPRLQTIVPRSCATM